MWYVFSFVLGLLLGARIMMGAVEEAVAQFVRGLRKTQAEKKVSLIMGSGNGMFVDEEVTAEMEALLADIERSTAEYEAEASV